MTLYVIMGEDDQEILFDEVDLNVARYRALHCINWTEEPMFPYGWIDHCHDDDTHLWVAVYERTPDGDVYLGEINRTGKDLYPSWAYEDEESDWISIDPNTGKLYKLYCVTISYSIQTAGPDQNAARQRAYKCLANAVNEGLIDKFEYKVEMVNDNQKPEE